MSTQKERAGALIDERGRTISEELWGALERGRYLRKDRTTPMLRETAQLADAKYGGDLRRLREEAHGDVSARGGARAGVQGHRRGRVRDLPARGAGRLARLKGG